MGEKTDMDEDGEYNWKNNPMAMSGETIVWQNFNLLVIVNILSVNHSK